MGVILKNYDFEDFPIEYKQRLFTWRTIDLLTDNKVEMLKIILIKRFLYNRRYKINPLNANYDD